MMPTQLTPPPLRTPLTDERGYVTQGAWTQFFTNAYLRSGGISAPSLSDLGAEVTQAEHNITALQQGLTTTQTTVASLQTDVDTLDATIAEPNEIAMVNETPVLAALASLAQRVALLELLFCQSEDWAPQVAKLREALADVQLLATIGL